MTRPCCKRSRCGTTFQCTNGEMENGCCSQYCGQRTMTIKGAKRNVPHLLQAPICLRSISETLQCQKFRGIVIMCWAIFSRYCGQRTMTIKGAKRNVPHLLQAQQAPICLRSISEMLQCQKFRGIVTKSTVYNRVCWSLRSYGAVFQQISDSFK